MHTRSHDERCPGSTLADALGDGMLQLDVPLGIAVLLAHMRACEPVPPPILCLLCAIYSSCWLQRRGLRDTACAIPVCVRTCGCDPCALAIAASNAGVTRVEIDGQAAAFNVSSKGLMIRGINLNYTPLKSVQISVFAPADGEPTIA